MRFFDSLTWTFTVKNLVGGRTYYFQVFANAATNYGVSDQVKFPVPARVKHKAITAGVVGGILFFLVAIILSICAVKICNKRKRRKQEKGNGHDAPWRCHVMRVIAITPVFLPAMCPHLCFWLCRLSFSPRVKLWSSLGWELRFASRRRRLSKCN